jgi:erythromycin esterase-like protein
MSCAVSEYEARERSTPAIPEGSRAELLARAAEPILGAQADYDSLLEMIGDNHFVLLGESTHGTREFYRERARIARRLIEEKGFTILAIEAEWQDAYDLNEYIHGRGAPSERHAFATFDRFPSWMWGNEEMLDLVSWLREWNASPRGRERPVGIYGIDLYSVMESVSEVLSFLDAQDPAAAARAREHYKCFDPYRLRGIEEYGRAVARDRRASCAEPAIAAFQELADRMQRSGRPHGPDDALVSAWQSARIVMNGEAYYRTAGTVSSWNLRDRHMADTIDALSEHLQGSSPRAKVMVWAHTSHLGDALMTARADVGELNVGQLIRQRHDSDSVLIGLTTYEGTVRAASAWGGKSREQRLTPALSESYAALFREMGLPAFVLRLRDNPSIASVIPGPRLQRFVGVIYAPATERQRHYVNTDLAVQYDAVIHIDRTTAVKPLAWLVERR